MLIRMKEVAGYPAITPILQGKRRGRKVCRMTTTEKASQRYDITDGPTSDRIWDAAKYSQDKNEAKIPVRFTTSSRLAGPIETSAWLILTPDITGVEHEDGSGDSLIFSGYLRGRRFKGYYKGRRREGFIEVYAR